MTDLTEDRDLTMNHQFGLAGPSALLSQAAADGAKEPVHYLGALLQNRPELLSVHGLGDMAAGVASKPCDLLDRHPIVGQQREEPVPQVARRPVPAEPGSLANVLEHPPDVPRTQRCTVSRGEYLAAVLPRRSGSLPLSRLVRLPPGACTGGSRPWLPGLRLAF